MYGVNQLQSIFQRRTSQPMNNEKSFIYLFCQPITENLPGKHLSTNEQSGMFYLCVVSTNYIQPFGGLSLCAICFHQIQLFKKESLGVNKKFLFFSPLLLTSISGHRRPKKNVIKYDLLIAYESWTTLLLNPI